jgi:hypothetical protein
LALKMIEKGGTLKNKDVVNSAIEDENLSSLVQEVEGNTCPVCLELVCWF